MQLIYYNDRNEHLILTNDGNTTLTPILLTEVDGIHGLDSDVRMIRHYGQDGETIIDSTLERREITISGKIVRDVVETRKRMLEIMNPKLQGALTLQRGSFVRFLAVKIDMAPRFSVRDGSTFRVSFVAGNPYWMSTFETRQDIAVWEAMFEWPLDIPETGISFGERSEILISDINNPGEATVGMRVVFRAERNVQNPTLTNVRTGKRMRVVINMAVGDELTITTGYGDKSVMLRRAGASEPVNAVNYLDIADPEFEFLQMAPGSNLLRYDAGYGSDSMLVSIHFTPGFLGV